MSAQEILEVEESIWEERVGKNASTKSLGPRNRIKGGIYTKEGKGIFVIKGRKGGSASVHGRSTMKRVYLTLQITTNITSALCGKKR